MSLSGNTANNERIAKNTVLMYVRMVFVMLVNLFIVRFVLKALGDVDYGVYNVVAGVITLFSCVSIVLASSTQRFYSIAIGRNDERQLGSIFTSSFNIFIVISIIIILVSETLGMWFVKTQLVIPSDRIQSALLVFHFSILSFVLSILMIPYYTSVISHEDMNIFALVSIGECLLKLILAIVLINISGDKLVLYALFLLLVQTTVFAIYVFIGRSKYRECHYVSSLGKDKGLYKELLSFSGWTLFGSVASVCMMQGITIIINIFFGPIISTARAISLQVYVALNSFVNSFVVAIRPPMVKSFAEDNIQYLNQLFYISNKFIFYCMLIIVIPLYVEMPFILNVWLGGYSSETLLFSRLIVVFMVIISLQNPITIIMQAIGKVKQYFVPVESSTLICLPLTYYLYKGGFAPEYAYYCMIFVALVSHLIRLICLNKYYNSFSFKKYFLSFALPAVFIAFLCTIISLFVSTLVDNSFLRLLLLMVINSITLIILVLYLGLESSERDIILSLLKQKH